MNEERASVIESLLVSRAYLYRLFHVVFGAEPSPEVLDLLSSEASASAFAVFSAAEGDALGRAAGIAAAVRERRAAESDLLDVLKSQYTRLLILPGDAYLRPWESSHAGVDETIFQESTLDVRRRYAAFGYRAAEFKHFPEDHIAMMCSFLAEMGDRTAEAFGEQGGEGCTGMLAAQGDFIDAHMLNWVDGFADEVAEKDATGLWAAYARALAAFAHVDRAFIDELLAR